MFLSLLRRKRPRMLIAKTCNNINNSIFNHFLHTPLNHSHSTANLNNTHPKSTLWFDVHDSKNRFVEDSIAYIFTRLCVCCNLLKIIWWEIFRRYKGKLRGYEVDLIGLLTCARMSFIASLESSSPFPRILSSLNIRTLKMPRDTVWPRGAHQIALGYKEQLYHLICAQRIANLRTTLKINFLQLTKQMTWGTLQNWIHIDCKMLRDFILGSSYLH